MPDMPGSLSPEIGLPAPEVGPRGPEARPERPTPAVERPPATSPVELTLPAQAVVVPPPAPAENVLEQRRVENILSEGLEEVYRGLDAATQQRVKSSGEQTARQITGLLREAKVQVARILELIATWLRGIPGLNIHFLEQEAKIKTDKVLVGRPPEP